VVPSEGRHLNGSILTVRQIDDPLQLSHRPNLASTMCQLATTQFIDGAGSSGCRKEPIAFEQTQLFWVYQRQQLLDPGYLLTQMQDGVDLGNDAIALPRRLVVREPVPELPYRLGSRPRMSKRLRWISRPWPA